MNEHTKDSDCTVDNATLCCAECGVDHGGQCDFCGGSGFHVDGCELEARLEKETAEYDFGTALDELKEQRERTTAPDYILQDFLEIPAWNVVGCVMEIRSAWYGSDDARRVLLQLDCDAPESEWKWFQLEPGEFVLV